MLIHSFFFVFFHQSSSIREFDQHATCVVAKYEVFFLMVESALSGYNNQQVFILDSLLHSASLLLLFIVGDFPLLSFLFH